MMSKRNHKDFRIVLADDDGVGETPEHQALDAPVSRIAGNKSERNDLFFEKIKRRINGTLEFCAKSRTFFLVPRCRLDRIFGSRDMNAQRAHQEPLMRNRIRRRNSFRSTRFAVPESISESRRMISMSQAFSTSESGGSSRLTTRLYASSARSASGRFKASERTFSNAVLVLLCQ